MKRYINGECFEGVSAKGDDCKETEDIVRRIRADLRLSMNGVVAASMREKGVSYRMVFGVSTGQLRKISLKYPSGKELAERLWREDVRELKILATLLYPPELFSRTTADRWVREINNQEMREQVSMNLFQKLPFAGALAAACIGDDAQQIRITGYGLFARLCITRPEELMETSCMLEKAVVDLENPSLLLRQSALNALRFYGRRAAERAGEVLRKVAAFEHSENESKREIFAQLRFEFDGDAS